MFLHCILMQIEFLDNSYCTYVFVRSKGQVDSQSMYVDDVEDYSRNTPCALN